MGEVVTEKKIAIYIFRCPLCQKVLASLSRQQCRYNAFQHMLNKHKTSSTDIKIEVYEVDL